MPTSKGDPRRRNRWTVFSREYLKRHPICAACGARATCTDHIIPVSLAPDTFRDEDYQPLCTRCNAVKSAYDRQMIQYYKQ